MCYDVGWNRSLGKWRAGAGFKPQSVLWLVKGLGWEFLDSDWREYIGSFLCHNVITLFSFSPLPLEVVLFKCSPAIPFSFSISLCVILFCLCKTNSREYPTFFSLRCSTIQTLGHINLGWFWSGWRKFNFPMQKALIGRTYVESFQFLVK